MHDQPAAGGEGPKDRPQGTTLLRKVLSGMDPADAMRRLTDQLRKTRSNAEFLAGIRVP